MTRHDQAPPLILPRGLIVICCVWTAASWLMLFGVRPPVQSVAASYTDSVTMMILSTTIGITIGWPLLRTSGRRFTLPFRQTALDIIVLACAIQVISWPLRLVSPWTIEQTILVTAALCAWLIPFGAIVRFGAGSDQVAIRTIAMIMAIVIVVVGAYLAFLTGDPWWSPLGSMTMLARSRQEFFIPGITGGVLATAIAGTGLWILLAGVRKVLEASGDRDS